MPGAITKIPPRLLIVDYDIGVVSQRPYLADEAVPWLEKRRFPYSLLSEA
jgi:hypothetical protein